MKQLLFIMLTINILCLSASDALAGLTNNAVDPTSDAPVALSLNAAVSAIDISEGKSFNTAESAINAPAGLVCNLLVRPELTVITTPTPQFGWAIPAGKANEKQTAYRILVATSLTKLNEDTGDMWDSGMTPSNHSQHIPYKGRELQPQSVYFWKVAFRNGNGEVSPFSNPQQFNTGEFGRTQAWPGESRC